MARGRSSFKMGTVEMLVLFLLSKKDLYGYEITTLIRKLSEELDINENEIIRITTENAKKLFNID